MAVLLLEIAPISTVAQTSPPQPEFRTFSPSGRRELVDPFTGDLQYNITLLEVPGPNGGYPINLSYRSGITMEQEAGWVGLGWTLNPGSIQRQVRGLPDDLDGDKGDVLDEVHDIQPNQTYGLGGDVDFEMFGADASVGTGITLGLKAYYNSYRGFGYTRTVGLSGQNTSSGIAGSVGLSLDSQEGLKASASLSLENTTASTTAKLDAARGVSSHTFGVQHRDLSVEADALNFIGYAKPASFPPVGRDMDGDNVAVSVKAGASIEGAYLNFNPNGFFIREAISQNRTQSKAFGYLNLEKAQQDGVVDFNRDKDGPIYDDSPNLAVPALTPDLFTVSAHGLAGTFRAYRNDIPVVFDKQHGSTLAGGAVGIELGGGLIAHFGDNGSINYTSSTTGRWDGGGKNTDAKLLTTLQNAVTNKSPNGVYERYYFKFIGEPTASSALANLPGREQAVKAPLAAVSWGGLGDIPPQYYRALPQLKTSDGQITSPPIDAIDGSGRVRRAAVIQAFTNDLLSSRRPALADLEGEHTSKRWAEAKGHLIGAFRITSPDGTRYAYGLPVYNRRYEQHEFSVDRAGRQPDSNCALVKPPHGQDENYDYQINGTEHFLHVRKLPPHATAYLLTAIVGPDYVDTDGDPGPSAGDVGYWVRFNYDRKAANFAWRDPFVGARFVRGYNNGIQTTEGERRNDKGVFTYGEREQWYLRSIETKTHIAIFQLEQRMDGIGAGSLLQNETPAGADPGQVSWRLSKISLYTREEFAKGAVAVPMREVHFEYDYSLASHVPNNPQHSGKLTLKKVWVTKQLNHRGEVSPYEFDYLESQPTANPNFGYGLSDRWDTYRPVSVTSCSASGASDPSLDPEVPYTPQEKGARDTNVVAWTLRKIVEPTGRIVQISYESDDYAWVQDKAALTMYSIESVNGSTGSSDLRRQIDFQSSDPSRGDLRRVYVRVPTGTTTAEFAQRYVPTNKQVFFKVRIDLKDGAYEFVSGYANAVGSGVVTTPPCPAASPDAEPCGATLGWVELGQIEGYHPLSVAAWQHLRLQQPELIRNSLFAENTKAGAVEEAIKVLTMVDFIDEIIDIARGVYTTWHKNRWGSRIELEHSWVRLGAAGGRKLGGGARVKAIEFLDGWDTATSGVESETTYGEAYDYTLPDGSTSGVASYEPFVGGEENAVHFAKPFSEKVLLASDYNLFFEGPANEIYFPAPVVGYSRVTVRSLASIRAAKDASIGGPLKNAKTSGPIVHEFYTAREFPVRTQETLIEKQRNPQPRWIPIPLLGEITLNTLAASQGYSIVVNDMHGKVKRLSTWEYTDQLVGNDFATRQEPVSSTEYIYGGMEIPGRAQYDLVNTVSVMSSDASSKQAELATDAEMFADMRLTRTESVGVGINLNLSTIYIYIPLEIPVPIPSVGYSLTEAKTVVINKVIHRAGVLVGVIQRKGSSRTVTTHMVFDEMTGRPVLDSTTNAFERPVYGYSFPARWQYRTMGPAYLNVGIQLPTTGAELPEPHTLRIPFPKVPSCDMLSSPTIVSCIAIGDELIEAHPVGAFPVRLTVVGVIDGGTLVLRAASSLAGVPGDLEVVRSGNRNLMNADMGFIRGLSDPTKGRGVATCSWQDSYPCGPHLLTTKQFIPDPDTTGWAAWLASPTTPGVSTTSPVDAPLTLLGANFSSNASVSQAVLSVLWPVNASSRCHVVLVSERGTRVDPSTINDVLDARYVPKPPGGRRRDPESGFPYGDVALTVERGDATLTVFVYSDCNGLIRTRDKVTIDNVGTCSRPSTAKYQTLDGILDATATTFTDYWPRALEDVRFVGSAQARQAGMAALAARDDFANGVRGIWRPRKRWVYVADRNQSQNVELRTDGTMDQVRLFDWLNDPSRQCPSKWRMQSEITSYSPAGFEIEARNALDIYSASLYGSQGSVPIAVAVNATNDEIGFEGFEEFTAGDKITPPLMGTGHIDFFTVGRRFLLPQADVPVCDAVRARMYPGRLLELPGPSFVLTSKSAQSSPSTGGASASVFRALDPHGPDILKSVEVPGLRCPLTVGAVGFLPGGSNLLLLDSKQPGCPDLGANQSGDLRERLRTPGTEAEIKICTNRRPIRVGPRIAQVVAITNTRAHTGRNSLLVREPVTFAQDHLALVPGRRYLLSAWVSRTDTSLPTFRTPAAPTAEAVGIQVGIWSGTQEIIAERPRLFEPTGPVIEGWQKIEGTFEMPPGADRISIRFQNGGPLAASVDAWFDDVRVSPEDAMFETHVYSPDSHRLLATLNENNFATFFSYDEDGSLYLVRRETVRGILSVQEGRTHLAER
jgi:hypothetical protein